MITTDIKIALKSLRMTKMRTALTMLGVIIGVASVTVVMALGEGAKDKVYEQATALGTNLLTIRPGRATRNAQGEVTNYDFFAALSASTISEHDLNTVAQTPHIAATAPIMAITGSVASNPTKPVSDVAIVATTPNCLSVMNFKIRTGSFINNATDRQTAVLGYDIAHQLLGSDTAIGQRVYLRGQIFTVIGILAPYDIHANFNNLFDFNSTVFIPFDAGKAFNQGIAQIQQIDARVANNYSPKALMDTIKQKLLLNHGGEEDFSVLQPQETVQIADNLLHFVTLLTSSVASISLLVGGIGIMNIMLVSVTERTREIGIRKAVGATNVQIMRQFLIEALLMSLTGGLIGVIVAYGSAFAIGTIFLNFMPVITWQIALVALGVSSAVGIVFGTMPAFKASRKDPIEALRFFQ